MAGKRKKDKTDRAGELLGAVGLVARNSRTRLSRQLLDHGLYAGQDALMLALDRDGGLAPGTIASILGVKAPTVTKMISRLAAQGVVRREESPDDGRMSVVFLTDLGHEKIKAISKAQRETEKLALKGFKKKEVKQLLAMLSAIHDNLDPRNNKLGAEDADKAVSSVDEEA